MVELGDLQRWYIQIVQPSRMSFSSWQVGCTGELTTWLPKKNIQHVINHPHSHDFSRGWLSKNCHNAYIGPNTFSETVWMSRIYRHIPWAPKTMNNKGFVHLKKQVVTIKTSKHVGFGGPCYRNSLELHLCSISQGSLHQSRARGEVYRNRADEGNTECEYRDVLLVLSNWIITPTYWK